jgi:hypothetical protein
MTIFSVIRKLMAAAPKKPRPRKIVTKGQHYDLQAIFNAINVEYFEGKLNLPITWSGNPNQAARYRRRLGSYNVRTGKIKIHRLLDHPNFPSYFISFVVYHEMLHHLVPPLKARGRRLIHHRGFKEKERAFKEYALARKWEKENLNLILGSHGRT